MVVNTSRIMLKIFIFGILLDRYSGDVCATDQCMSHGHCYYSYGEEDYRCVCDRGWQGRNCQHNLNNCYRDACQNEGHCVDQVNDRYVCNCTNEYVGNNCEFKNPCLNNPCYNGGQCNPMPDGTMTCQCSSYFGGDFCQIRTHRCPEKLQTSRRMCGGRGKCQNRKDGGLRCKCDHGYRGLYCNEKLQTGCSKGYCLNGGRCSRRRNGKYICFCNKNNRGSRCEVIVADTNLSSKPSNSPVVFSRLNPEQISTLSYPVQRSSQSTCPSQCQFTKSNGICDQKCNNKLCHYDGGDCDPWKRCRGESVAHCRNVFQNNICDPECNSVDCLFDGQDCDRSDCVHDRHCAMNYQDGVCNEDCNNPQCGFDGGDCHWKKSQSLFGSLENFRKCSVNKREFELNLVLLTTIANFRVRQVLFLQKLGSILKIVLTISNITQTTYRSLNAVSIVLNINPSECIVYGGQCFSSLEQISDFIKAVIPTSGYFQLPFRVVKVDSKTLHSSKPKRSQTNPYVILLITIGSALTVCFSVIAVLLRDKWRKMKEKVKTTGIWSPSDGISTSTLSISSNQKSNWSVTWSANNKYRLEKDFEDANNVTSRKRKYDIANLNTTALAFQSISESLLNQNGVDPINSTLSNLQTLITESPLIKSEESSPELGEYCNEFGESLLHIAARMNAGRSIIKTLHSVSPSMLRTTDKWGRTPLATAVASGSSESIKQLEDFEKIYRKETKQNRCRSIRNCFTEHSVAKTTGLIEAVKLNSDDIINLLLDEGRSVNVIDSTGRSVVHWAALYNNVAFLERLRGLKIFQKLVDFKDYEDKSPLFLAASEGNLRCVRFIVKYMLEYGINIDPISPSPSTVARDHGFREILAVISQVQVSLFRNKTDSILRGHIPMEKLDHDTKQLDILSEHMAESSKSNQRSLNDHDSEESCLFALDYLDNSTNINLLDCFATEIRPDNSHCNSYLSNSSSSEMSPPLLVMNNQNIPISYNGPCDYLISQTSKEVLNQSTFVTKSATIIDKQTDLYRRRPSHSVGMHYQYPLKVQKVPSINCPL